MSRRAYHLAASTPTVEDYFGDLKKLLHGKSDHELRADQRDYRQVIGHIKAEIKNTYLNPTWQHLHPFRESKVVKNTGILDNLWMWRAWSPADAIAYQLKVVADVQGYYQSQAVPYLKEVRKIATELGQTSDIEAGVLTALETLETLTFPGSRMPCPRMLGGWVYDPQAFHKNGRWHLDDSLHSTWEKGEMLRLGPENFKVCAEGILQLLDAFEQAEAVWIPDSDLTEGAWRGDNLDGHREYNRLLKELSTDGEARPAQLINYWTNHFYRLTDTAQGLERWLARSFK